MRSCLLLVSLLLSQRRFIFTKTKITSDEEPSRLHHRPPSGRQRHLRRLRTRHPGMSRLGADSRGGRGRDRQRLRDDKRGVSRGGEKPPPGRRPEGGPCLPKLKTSKGRRRRSVFERSDRRAATPDGSIRTAGQRRSRSTRKARSEDGYFMRS